MKRVNNLLKISGYHSLKNLLLFLKQINIIVEAKKRETKTSLKYKLLASIDGHL